MHRLDRLGDQRLQRMAFDRQPQADHPGDDAGVAGGDAADLAGADRAACVVSTPVDGAVLRQDVGHLALLDDVDAHRIGGARIAPDDGVVAVDAAGALQRGADHRIAQRRRDVDRRAEILDLLRVQPFRVDAVQPVRLDAAAQLPRLALVMREVEDAAMAHHDVEVELAAERLPEVERVIVDRGALVEEVVGADDRGVAAGIAAADPALLDHGDIGHAVQLGEVVGRREAVPAAADDDGVVARLRLRESARPAAQPLWPRNPSRISEKTL